MAEWGGEFLLSVSICVKLHSITFTLTPYSIGKKDKKSYFVGRKERKKESKTK